jgi:CubicO group peptidase (beta-lactamase class C family)
MEGWRQRRLGDKVRIHRQENKNVLTPTGLLMEGLDPLVQSSPPHARKVPKRVLFETRFEVKNPMGYLRLLTEESQRAVGIACHFDGVVMQRIVCLGLLLALMSRAAFCQSQGPSSAALESLDSVIAKQVSDNGVGGVTVGVVVGPDLVWTKSYGEANMESHIPAQQESVYRIGSITKQFTAVMLLQLVELGKVHLSDPVEKYFPEINKVKGRWPGAPPITFFQLATHTAGLAREPEDLPSYTVGPVSEWEKVLLKALEHTSYAYEPGTRYSYSNIGYAVLGAALARVAKEPYVEYVTKNISLPLGMTHTVFEPTQDTRRNLAKGYACDGKIVDTKVAEAEHNGRGYKVPNGAMYSTVGDLAKFVAFEMGFGREAILRKQSLESARKYLVSTDLLSQGYGIGLEASWHGDYMLLGHGGDVAGYVAAAYFEPQRKLGILFFHNGSGDKLDEWKMVSLMVDAIAPTLPAIKAADQ